MVAIESLKDWQKIIARLPVDGEGTEMEVHRRLTFHMAS